MKGILSHQMVVLSAVASTGARTWPEEGGKEQWEVEEIDVCEKGRRIWPKRLFGDWRQDGVSLRMGQKWVPGLTNC